MSVSDKKSDMLVIVGGGPVGLWTAIQIKSRKPETSIIVYEKYSSYRRSHVLRLKRLSLSQYTHKTHAPDETRFYDSLLGKNSSSSSFKPIFIRTQELEEILKNYAQNLGVQIRYEDVKSVEDLRKQNPDCTTFIGADGAHSLVRREIFHDEYRVSKNLQYIVELKYDVAGKTKPLDILTDHYKSIKILPYSIFEYVGRERNSFTPITIRFFVPLKIYAAIGEANFKNPITIDDYKQRLPQDFSQTINIYLTIRKEVLHDDPMFSTMKLGKLTLSVYGVKEFAKHENGADWYLIGDSAIGVPYFRSLNAGLLCGSKFAKLWARPGDTIAAYNAYGRKRLAIEHINALLKNISLKAHALFIRVSAVVPWQVNKWRQDDIRHYMQNLYSDEDKAA